MKDRPLETTFYLHYVSTFFPLAILETSSAFLFVFATACNDIDRWSTPYPGKILTLPIMGVVMKVAPPPFYFVLKNTLMGVTISAFSGRFFF